MTQSINKIGNLKSFLIGNENAFMQLCDNPDADFMYNYSIDFYIPTKSKYVKIGIYCSNNSKKVLDFDGIFDIPKEAIELLENNGFDCSQIK